MAREQDGVGAEVDEFLSGNDASDNLRQLAVHERLAAGDGHDRRIAFIDRPQRVGYAHALLQYLFWVIDLAAAGAGEIALEQRLEHQDERITLLTAQLAGEYIAADAVHLQQRNAQ